MVKEIIGWREKIELVDFDNSIIKAKLDTGARTSSLHATHISESEDSGEKYVSFRLKNIGTKTKYKYFKCKAKRMENRKKFRWRRRIQTCNSNQN